jgi:hypothetical protein
MDRMPTTLAGLLVFVVMLLPGFVFITLYTWDRPRRRWSAVEEAAAIVLASFLIEAVTAGLYFLFLQIPKVTAPSLDLLIREPDEHLGWVVGLLGVSAGLAALASWPMRRRRVHPAVTSSWWTLFDKWQHGRDYTTTHIECSLDDGSAVTGVLGDWNTGEDESGDRDLILGAPITYKPPGRQEYHEHPVSVVCISARRIVAMFVAYRAGTSPTSAQAEAEAAPGEVGQAEASKPSPARSPDAAPETPRPARSTSARG